MKKRFSILFVIGLLLAFFVIPRPEGLSEQGWQMLFVFILIAFLWVTEVFHLAVTSIIGICLIFLLDGASTAFSGFGSSAFFVILVGFGIATGLTVSGLDTRIANSLLKHAKDERIFLAWLMGATATLSLLMSNTTTVILMIPILVRITEKTRFNRVMMFLALAFSANVGGVGFLIGSPPNIIAADVLGWGFNKWLSVGMPFMIVMLGLLYASFLIMFRPSGHSRNVTPKRMPGWSKKEKFATSIIVLTLALWLSSPIHGLKTVAVGLIGTVLMFIFVYDWNNFREETDWGILFLIGGAISLGTALTKAGTANWIADSLLSLTGTSHPVLIVFGFTVLAMTMTQFIQNTATAAVFAPILLGMAPSLGISPAALVIPMAIGVSMTFLFPPGTAPNAIVFSKASISTKEMFKAGLLPTLIALVVLFILGFILI